MPFYYQSIRKDRKNKIHLVRKKLERINFFPVVVKCEEIQSSVDESLTIIISNNTAVVIK